MSTSLDNTWGALSFPIPVGVSGDLTALDPARDILLALLSAAITYELTPAWTVASAGTDLAVPVASVLPALDDLDTMRQRGATFPMLAVSRSTDPQTEDEFTLWQNRITSKWTIDYVLGPLEIGDQLKLCDALTAAGKVIAGTIRAGGHKAFATSAGPVNTVTAKQVFGPGVGLCSFSTVGITSYIQGAAAISAGGPKYHALTMTLQTTELDSIADEGVPYTGQAATIDGGPVLSIDTAVPLQPG
jgi:hypothetical protein